MIKMGDTWIDDEELAYPRGSIRASRRRGVVRYLDGKLRKVTLGVPDTYFTIPARGKANGRTLSGYVFVRDAGEATAEFVFNDRQSKSATKLVPVLY